MVFKTVSVNITTEQHQHIERLGRRFNLSDLVRRNLSFWLEQEERRLKNV